jgi:peptidoglycan/LPS O-acetylase OafA/YrhL
VLVIGFCGVLALVYFAPSWRPLERIGAYSFTIYLLHPFSVAPSRKTLRALDLDTAGQPRRTSGPRVPAGSEGCYDTALPAG